MRKFLCSISISLSLLLCLPIPILANEELYVGGDSVGVELKYDGVLVMGTYPYTVSNHSYDPSTLLQEGDVIVAINQKKIHGLHDFYDALDNQVKELSSVNLTYMRNNRSYSVTFPIVYDEQECTYKTGLYMKEAIHGIGTITFYNENNHRFAALGHAMMDEMPVPLIQNGTLFHAIITSYQKATMSTSGRKNGSICYRRKIGDIDTNNQFGIYGSYQTLPSNARKYEVASVDEIKKGPAIFLTVLDQNTIESFPIEITSIHKQKELKGIEFQVKDERLLKQTGGIIQGMSGSPILQNGKIVGAVTHVLVNDPTRGYGIFIENMLEAAE